MFEIDSTLINEMKLDSSLESCTDSFEEALYCMDCSNRCAENCAYNCHRSQDRK